MQYAKDDYYKEAAHCKPCLRRLVGQIAGMSTNDEELRRRAEEIGMEMVERQFRPGKTPAETATDFARAIRALTGVDDPFKEHKRREVEVAREALSTMTIKSDDMSLMELAVLGNTVDYFKTPERVRRELADPVDFGIDHRAGFLEKLYMLSSADKAKSKNGQKTEDTEEIGGALDIGSGERSQKRELLYLADNAAELMFDIPCLMHWHEKGVKVVLVLKGGPVQNDATLKDLEALDSIELPFEVVDNGTDGVGTPLEECSEAFRKRFERAGLILAKGMANFESLRAEKTPDILFLLLAKCPVNARFLGVKEGRAAALFRSGIV